jgi:hypothetical protein
VSLRSPIKPWSPISSNTISRSKHARVRTWRSTVRLRPSALRQQASRLVRGDICQAAARDTTAMHGQLISWNESVFSALGLAKRMRHWLDKLTHLAAIPGDGSILKDALATFTERIGFAGYSYLNIQLGRSLAISNYRHEWTYQRTRCPSVSNTKLRATANISRIRSPFSG